MKTLLSIFVLLLVAWGGQAFGQSNVTPKKIKGQFKYSAVAQARATLERTPSPWGPHATTRSVRRRTRRSRSFKQYLEVMKTFGGEEVVEYE